MVREIEVIINSVTTQWTDIFAITDIVLSNI